jgi:hypothetical protein
VLGIFQANNKVRVSRQNSTYRVSEGGERLVLLDVDNNDNEGLFRYDIAPCNWCDDDENQMGNNAPERERGVCV